MNMLSQNKFSELKSNCQLSRTILNGYWKAFDPSTHHSEVYEFIQEHEGTTQEKICDYMVDVAQGRVAQICTILEKAGLIKSAWDGNYKKYFSEDNSFVEEAVDLLINKGQ